MYIIQQHLKYVDGKLLCAEKFTFARWSRNAFNLRNAKISHKADRIQLREEWMGTLGVKIRTV
jgi:hypothetical protein